MVQYQLKHLQELRKQFADTYTEADKREAFTKATEIVKEYSEELVKRWKEEIDTLLVYVHISSTIQQCSCS